MALNRKKFLLRDCLGWGFALWLVGYMLGFLFYAVVPTAMIGWYVMPLGIALTCFVLWKWIRPQLMGWALMLGAAWTAIAIACDYVFIVMLLKPPDGYYKLDVYAYYAITLALPVLAAWFLRERERA